MRYDKSDFHDAQNKGCREKLASLENDSWFYVDGELIHGTGARVVVIGGSFASVRSDLRPALMADGRLAKTIEARGAMARAIGFDFGAARSEPGGPLYRVARLTQADGSPFEVRGKDWGELYEAILSSGRHAR